MTINNATIRVIIISSVNNSNSKNIFVKNEVNLILVKLNEFLTSGNKLNHKSGSGRTPLRGIRSCTHANANSFANHAKTIIFKSF
ncbi:unnamed protein product [Brugia timori]|uniref:Uncharacterized protein n=1 Tax=Brugia timori TaxID=42155 RepID=A0A0R3RA06_9BILA|nr:unnamed protein product [Brugia timori]